MTHWIQHQLGRANRFWRHERNNRDAARLNVEIQRNAPVPVADARPVVIFNASTRLQGISLNAAFSRVSSHALQLAGVPVVNFVCQQGLTRCVLGTDRDDFNAAPPCKVCLAQSRALYHGTVTRGFTYQADPDLDRALASLPLAELMNFEYQGVPLGTLVLPALRWVLRRHTLADDEPTRFLLRQYLASAWQVARSFTQLLDEVNPQAVLVFNGQFYPEATARWLARQRGLPVIAHEVGMLPLTGYFTRGEATAYPIDIPASFALNEDQNARLDAYLQDRFKGNFTMAGIQFWPEMRSLGEEFWQRARQFKQVVPIFTNVIFDTSQSHANVLFSDMFVWLDALLDVIKAHPETFFVLRAHPDESRAGKASRESVADWVKKRAAAEVPNLLFVDSSQPFSSYELIQRSKFVMIYNSTIGLEAALMGAAVLCAGKARFTQLPTVYFPVSAEEYLRQTEEFLAADAVAPLPEFQPNARRFLYYQLYRTSLPFAEFLEPDGIWRGFVRFKALSWQAYRPQNSATLQTIVDGILRDGDFLLPEKVNRE